MTSARTPFAERLRQACHLASLELGNTGNLDVENSVVLAEAVSARLGERLTGVDVDGWRCGASVPSRAQRRALAQALGLGDDLELFLVSDDEDVVRPLESQVDTFLTLAENRSGLLALRRTGPIDEKAVAALRSLIV